MIRTTLLFCVSLMVTLTLSAQAKTTPKNTTTTAHTSVEKTLFDRLGGKTAISAVVDEFVANCAADTRINKFFAGTAADKGRMTRFKTNLAAQICEASGGPCKYHGKTMKVAHAGMGVKEEHFTAMVEDLSKALDKFKVGDKEKTELVNALGAMKNDIVEHAG